MFSACETAASRFQMAMSARWKNRVSRNMNAPKNSTPLLPILATAKSVTTGPKSAPTVPPAAMMPNRRLLCCCVKSSSRKLQNTDTMKRFSTLMNT